MNIIKNYLDKFLWASALFGAILTVVRYKQYYIQSIEFVNIALIILVVFLLYKFNNPNNVIFKQMSSEELCSEVIKESKKLNKVLIYNPDKSYIWLTRLNKEFLEKSCEVSYIGDAEDFIQLMDFMPKDETGKRSDKLMTDFMYNSMFIILTNPDVKHSVVAFVDNNKSYIIKVKDKTLNNIIRSYVNKKTLSDFGIDLDKFDDPKTILNIISNKKDRYLHGFNELKSGAITFYGTEVLEVSAGWLESNEYKEVDTLDITVNPAIFKTRVRYNNISEKLLKNDASIKRVYMFEEEKLKDGQYCKDLYDEINYQHSVGAKTGIQYLETLPLHYIQDFIIYGNNIVLLENKQADKNYSIASSTAYFDKSKILEYREMFNQVWNGKYSPEKPKDVAAAFLKFYEKTYA